jgi:hypothetical protein
MNTILYILFGLITINVISLPLMKKESNRIRLTISLIAFCLIMWLIVLLK